MQIVQFEYPRHSKTLLSYLFLLALILFQAGDERVKNLVLSMMLYGVLLRTGYFGDEVPDNEARIRVMVVLHRLLEIQARR